MLDSLFGIGTTIQNVEPVFPWTLRGQRRTGSASRESTDHDQEMRQPAGSEIMVRPTPTDLVVPLQRWLITSIGPNRHSLSTAERQAYIDAELCLMSKPGTLGLRGGRTKFDEFQSIHVSQAEIAHFVGQFFPFHRLYVWAHEVALRKECGYTGAQP